MDDRYQELKRQAERGNQLDEKARDLYRITFLVISIFVAATAINIDLGVAFRYLMYESGPLLGENGAVTFTGQFPWFVELILLLVGLLFLLLAYLAFVVGFAAGLLLFISSPYYAIRAITCSKISKDEKMSHVLSQDIIELIRTINPLSGGRCTPDRIIGDVEYTPEKHGDIETVIHHNRIALEYKSRNLSRAENSTKLFFVSLISLTMVIALVFGYI